MATYKFAAEKKFGKFHGALNKAGVDNIPTSKPAHDTMEDLLGYLGDQLESQTVSEDDDTVIFRNVGYDDFSQLEWAVKRATY
jgi:hypothetical protein